MSPYIQQIYIIVRFLCSCVCLYNARYCTRTLTVSTASWEWTHETNKQNANKLKSIFISNNSFYLLQLKGCHKQHLIAIYVVFIEESIDARLVWQNIGKKMGSYGGALTVA